MWKEIDMIDGRKLKPLYSVNELGEVKNNIRNKLLSIQDNGTGYKTVSVLLNDNKKAVIYIHRLVAAYFIDDRLKNKNILVINHLDLNRGNNNFTNLSVCTQKENIHYSIQVGSINNKGSNNNNSVFTEQEVMLMCECMEAHPTLKYEYVLKSVGKNPTQNNLAIVTKIRSGKLWKHISSNYNIPQRKRKSMNSFSDKKEYMIKLIVNDNNITYKEIANKLNINIEDKNEREKLYKIVQRLKQKLL